VISVGDTVRVTVTVLVPPHAATSTTSASGDNRRMRPLIGITAYAEPSVRWGAWDLPAALVPLAYVRAVELSGGRPLLVPPAKDGVEETLDALHALVLSGGSDLDPARYGADAHPETTGIRDDRDSAELALLQAALARDLPVLAICRGSQLLNVTLGGDLVQHLPEHVGHDGHKETPGAFSRHGVELEPGSRLAAVLGERADVLSHHHQGFGRLGAGLRAAARADDGTIEALEATDRRFAIGVLWHPEANEDLALFRRLVAQARVVATATGPAAPAR
jgi:gamma-glutamyl-gamma-aminobutyrate hydrolase PuuD